MPFRLLESIQPIDQPGGRLTNATCLPFLENQSLKNWTKNNVYNRRKGFALFYSLIHKWTQWTCDIIWKNLDLGPYGNHIIVTHRIQQDIGIRTAMIQLLVPSSWWNFYHSLSRYWPSNDMSRCWTIHSLFVGEMDWDGSRNTWNYRQSGRLDIKYIDQLLTEGKAYKSYVTGRLAWLVIRAMMKLHLHQMNEYEWGRKDQPHPQDVEAGIIPCSTSMNNYLE